MSREGPPSPDLGPQVGDERRRPPLAPPGTGRLLIVADVVGTAVFCAVAIGQVVAPADVTLPLMVVSLVGFAVGSAAFLWAFAVAVSRSRTDAIGMGGLYFLSRTAARPVQVVMLVAWAIQIVVAFVVASLGVFTGAAFALLAPMWGIGLSGMWGARHGAFPPRSDAPATSPSTSRDSDGGAGAQRGAPSP